MKNYLILILAAILLTAASSTNTLTERSTQQIVLVNQNTQLMKSQIETYYKVGFRVTSSTAQSISNRYITEGHTSDKITKGDIIVIMEK